MLSSKLVPCNFHPLTFFKLEGRAIGGLELSVPSRSQPWAHEPQIADLRNPCAATVAALAREAFQCQHPVDQCQHPGGRTCRTSSGDCTGRQRSGPPPARDRAGARRDAGARARELPIEPRCNAHEPRPPQREAAHGGGRGIATAPLHGDVGGPAPTEAPAVRDAAARHGGAHWRRSGGCRCAAQAGLAARAGPGARESTARRGAGQRAQAGAAVGGAARPARRRRGGGQGGDGEGGGDVPRAR
eukprot:scaffold51088_cov60-Phaeocystis_antarctica.AAC.2